MKERVAVQCFSSFLWNETCVFSAQINTCKRNVSYDEERWLMLLLMVGRSEKMAKPVEFIIDETFGVPGVGTVVAGTVKQGVIHTNSNLLLGPSVRDGEFHQTAIKSIHYKRLPVTSVSCPSPIVKAWTCWSWNCAKVGLRALI